MTEVDRTQRTVDRLKANVLAEALAATPIEAALLAAIAERDALIKRLLAELRWASAELRKMREMQEWLQNAQR